MTRVIKFRGWDKENKQMVPDFDNWIDFSGKYWTIPDKTYDTPNIEVKQFEGFEIMQFTGLVDCEGNEIWENDWVEWDEKRDWGEVSKQRAFVTWEDNSTGFYPFCGWHIVDNGNINDNTIPNYKRSYKVIGNKWEGIK